MSNTKNLKKSLNNNFNLSRSITVVENRLSGYKDLLSFAYTERKNIQKIGITGPPGAGKSTITNFLCKNLIEKNERIAIISVDPTSPFNGGAILGDRIRMKDVNHLKNVFIRSIGSRGSTGGLTDTINEVIILLESAGFNRLIIETVGVGQVEIDVMHFCDTVVLCLTPESGDDIQMMKSGLIECAHILSINKSDRPGAERLNIFLNQLLDLSQNSRKPPILNLIALKNEGIDELAVEIDNHYNFLKSSGEHIQKDIDSYKSIAIKSLKNYLLKNFLNEQRISLINNEANKAIHNRIPPYDILKILKND